MSIERSSTTVNPKAATGTEGAKGKGKAAEGSGTSGALGFSALLTSIESESTICEKDLGVPDQSAEVDVKLLAAEPMPMPMAALAVASQQNDVSSASAQDLAMLLAQAGTAISDKLDDFGDGSVLGEKGASIAVIGADKHLALNTAMASLGGGKLGGFSQTADDALAQVEQSSPARTQKLRGGHQVGPGINLVESRVLKAASSLDMAANAPALSGALVGAGLADAVVRPLERGGAKPLAMQAGPGVEGSWGYQSLLTGTRVDPPAAMPDPAALSLESMVADTVSYWVTQGVQNAELTLDGLGTEPVEVTISLKGDEAHVGFRTDQVEVRQMLEGAVAHLKDLLTSEGLVLSGVSVGSSGQDRAGSQDRRSGSTVRQATLTKVDVQSPQILPRASATVGRAVDLFV